MDGPLLSSAEPVKGRWAVLVALGFAQFALAASVSLQAPFFPKEAEMKGASATIYGMVFGVFELAVIVSSPICGKLVTKVGSKFLVTSGMFLTGSCCILFGTLDKSPSGTKFVVLAFAVRILEGVGCAAVMTSSYTVISSVFPDKIARTFSALETLFGVGLIAGPTIGGLLYEAQGFYLPFLVMGLVTLACDVLCIIYIKESEAPQKASGDFWNYVCDLGVAIDASAIVGSLLFIGFNCATLEPHLRQFEISPAVIGLIFVINGSIYALTSPIWGFLCDRGVSPRLLCIMGYGLQCGNLLLLGPAFFLPFGPSLSLVITSLALGGLGMASKILCAFLAALKDAENRGYPNDISTQAMVSAMYSSACSIGAFVGPTAGGFLLDTVGYRAAITLLLLIEIIVMIMTVLYAIFNRGKKYTKLNDTSVLYLHNSAEITLHK